MSDTLAALYLRVSTLDQHPETQLHDLRQLAAQRGLEVAGLYEDRMTGTRASRPGLDRLMRDARQGKFQVLVVWSCDRLARSVTHFLQVLDELNHLGIEFVSFREQLDTGGPLGRAITGDHRRHQRTRAPPDRGAGESRAQAGEARRTADRPSFPEGGPGRAGAGSGAGPESGRVGGAAPSLQNHGQPGAQAGSARRSKTPRATPSPSC